MAVSSAPGVPTLPLGAALDREGESRVYPWTELESSLMLLELEAAGMDRMDEEEGSGGMEAARDGGFGGARMLSAASMSMMQGQFSVSVERVKRTVAC